MANGWTPERRAQQAEAIKRWKPWQQSTGPQTDEGKAAASQNALKHGVRSAEWRDRERRLAALLRECRQRAEELR